MFLHLTHVFYSLFAVIVCVCVRQRGRERVNIFGMCNVPTYLPTYLPMMFTFCVCVCMCPHVCGHAIQGVCM